MCCNIIIQNHTFELRSCCVPITSLNNFQHYADVGPESVMLVLNTSGNDDTLSPEVSPLREFNW